MFDGGVGGQRSLEPSPPDVRGLGVFLLSHHSGFQVVAARSLAAIAWVNVKTHLTSFVLVALPWRARVIRLGAGRRGVAVVLDGRAGGRWDEGGAEAQAVAKRPPVLLTL